MRQRFPAAAPELPVSDVTKPVSMHAAWKASGARLLCEPESKHWHLHEFWAEDLDGNRLRVFYDFAWELPDKGKRRDDTEAIKQALGKGGE